MAAASLNLPATELIVPGANGDSRGRSLEIFARSRRCIRPQTTGRSLTVPVPAIVSARQKVASKVSMSTKVTCAAWLSEKQPSSSRTTPATSGGGHRPQLIAARNLHRGRTLKHPTHLVFKVVRPPVGWASIRSRYPPHGERDRPVRNGPLSAESAPPTLLAPN